MSVLLRPTVAPTRWPLLSLLAGVAACEAVHSVAGVEASLKWPNDLLVEDRKLGGILAERVADAVVIGIGINVSTKPAELPHPGATSLGESGAGTDREPLVKELLRALGRAYLGWRAEDGRPGFFMDSYRTRCRTLGREVTVEQPDGGRVVGRAVAIDDEGRLVLADADGARRAFAVGDVVHARQPDEP
jgi:BirA family biotin operon repressor/biotin-[acetyl-CoA-carboxylase] ligase